MRRGMVGLAMQVQQVLSQNPFDGAVFAFCGRGFLAVLRLTTRLGRRPDDPQAGGRYPGERAKRQVGRFSLRPNTFCSWAS